MSAAVGLRDDFTASDLRRLAARAKDADQVRRLLALAAVYDGMDRETAARIGGMDRQTLRDWAHRFNEYGPVWPHQCQTSGSSAEAVGGATRGIAAVGGGRPRSGEAWRGPLAMRGLAACPGSPVRRRSVDSGDWSPAQAAWLLAYQRPPAAPRTGCAGDCGF